MSEAATIIPMSKTPVKVMLSAEEEKLLALLAKIIANSVNKKYEKMRHPLPPVQQ